MRPTPLIIAALGAALLSPTLAALTMPDLAAPPPAPASPIARQAGEADPAAYQDALRWLSEAESAIAAGRTGTANELLERAETRILTRGTLASIADQPSRQPAVSQLGAARQALRTGNSAEALRLTEAARATLTAPAVAPAPAPAPTPQLLPGLPAVTPQTR